MPFTDSNVLVLNKKDRFIWLGGLTLCGGCCALVAALSLPKWTLQVLIAITVLWIIVPVGVLFYRQSRRDAAAVDLELGEGVEVDAKKLTPPSAEEISSFLDMVKSESSMSISTVDTSIEPRYEDLCPICLDEHDIGDTLCTLAVWVYETARSSTSGKKCTNEVLGSIKCPLCRQPMFNSRLSPEQLLSVPLFPMTETVGGDFIDISFPRHFRWVWLSGVVVITMSFIVLAAMHKTFPGLIVAFGVALLWIALPVIILLVKMTKKYGFRQGIQKLREGPKVETEATQQKPTAEDKKAFLEAAKSASQVTLDTTAAPQDLCPICLDEEDMGDPLITLRCGHVFHEKCIDSVIDTAYEKMYAPNYLGLPILPRDQVLSSLRCPLCRSQMTDVNDNDIEDGIPQATTTTETPSGSSVDDDPTVETSPAFSRPLARVPPTFYLTGTRVGDAPHVAALPVVVQL
ncbi:hypothetical protein FOZ60_017325 [Perkinsus olseni]|uniref:RING-type domain-containing protein n=2 Tax=Perkinsus olseni TaxID=32597 RepID=A0A7J6P2S4_PEROL|nr:hypothetical protein FOZ60_017325 [Perkinsus olseni]